MRRTAGAIFLDSRPATIMRSAWRGEARKTSAPNREMSYRDAAIDIISIAQHARPSVTGQIEDRRAHCAILSTVVVKIGISKSGAIAHPPASGAGRGPDAPRTVSRRLHVPC